MNTVAAAYYKEVIEKLNREAVRFNCRVGRRYAISKLYKLDGSIEVTKCYIK